MNLVDANKVLERISRLSERTKNIRGDGSSWSYTFPDGIKTTYILNKVKPPEELEDEILNVFLWIWNFKDYLKESIKHHGGDTNRIEQMVNSDQKLAICADIANGLKHGSLSRTRSGKKPKLGVLRYRVPQRSMKRLTFRGPEIEFDFQNFEDIEIKMPIVDSLGNEIGQALDYLKYALDIWEQESAVLRDSQP